MTGSSLCLSLYLHLLPPFSLIPARLTFLLPRRHPSHYESMALVLTEPSVETTIPHIPHSCLLHIIQASDKMLLSQKGLPGPSNSFSILILSSYLLYHSHSLNLLQVVVYICIISVPHQSISSVRIKTSFKVVNFWILCYVVRKN